MEDLETSEDFKVAEKNTPLKEQKIESLKITVRELSKEDIKLEIYQIKLQV